MAWTQFGVVDKQVVRSHLVVTVRYVDDQGKAPYEETYGPPTPDAVDWLDPLVKATLDRLNKTDQQEADIQVGPVTIKPPQEDPARSAYFAAFVAYRVAQARLPDVRTAEMQADLAALLDTVNKAYSSAFLSD